MIGNLKHRIILQRRIATENGRGGFSFSYETVGEFWASVLPLNNFDVVKYREQGIEANVKILMRYDPDPDKRPQLLGRVLLKTKLSTNLYYEIVGLIDDLFNGDYFEMLGVTRRQ